MSHRKCETPACPALIPVAAEVTTRTRRIRTTIPSRGDGQSSPLTSCNSRHPVQKGPSGLTTLPVFRRTTEHPLDVVHPVVPLSRVTTNS